MKPRESILYNYTKSLVEYIEQSFCIDDTDKSKILIFSKNALKFLNDFYLIYKIERESFLDEAQRLINSCSPKKILLIIRKALLSQFAYIYPLYGGYSKKATHLFF